MNAAVTIHRYLDVPARATLGSQIDAIFFEASNTQSFESGAARAVFRERWLGRYLRDDSQFAYLALNPVGDVAGYLVGAIDDPAASARFADLGYFAVFCEQTQRFPAHVHLNIGPDFRGSGVGGRLIDAFIADARRAGVPGVHVITGVNARNVRFYNRQGFNEHGRTGGADGLVLLGRAL
jgi:GNAT superfamily N-acetyltransferase